MKKKILTLDDLAKFCKENKLYSFSAENSGYQLSVEIPATFESEEYDANEGLLMAKIKVCHTNLNLNGSFIPKDVMSTAMPSLKNRPVLASIHQRYDGSYDFHGHDIEILEDGNVKYIESQVGSFTGDEPVMEHDDESGNDYVIARAVIPREYTKAADIIEAKNGTDVSCEISINEMSYNAKDNYLQIDDFYFSGCTLLGSEDDGKKIRPGMEGAKLEIEDFSEKNNSLFSRLDSKLVEITDMLKSISDFNNKNTTEGGEKMTKFEELLKKYEVAKEDISFDYEKMSDEEIEKAFADAFACGDDKKEKESCGGGDDKKKEDEACGGGDDKKKEDEACGGGGGKKKNSKDDSDDEPCDDDEEGAECGDDKDDDENKYSVKAPTTKFELSFDDIWSALYSLECDSYGESYYPTEVFESYFISKDFDAQKYYKEGYSVENDTVSLSGDRVEVFSEYLTKDELSKLDDMRKNYSVISEKLAEYETAEAKAKKEETLTSDVYSCVFDTEEYKKLVNDADKYSVDEVTEMADKLLLEHVKKQQFSAKIPEKKKSKILFGSTDKDTEKGKNFFEEQLNKYYSNIKK